LQAGALTMRLTIVNLAVEPLPFGLGFHPWIVRAANTQLSAKAQWVRPGDKRPPAVGEGACVIASAMDFQ
jgi:galactose mutarotase-like enzyme